MFESSVIIDPAAVYPDLAAAIDAIPVRATRGGTAADSAVRVRALTALSEQVKARWLAEVAAFDDQGFATACGAQSTGSFLAAHGHMDAADARRAVVAARTADRLPQLGAMLAAGDLTVDHVAAVGFSTSRVPPEIVTSFDAVFATLAASAKPSDLRVAGKQLQHTYDTDAISRDADHVHATRYLTLAQTFGDAWHLEGLLTPEDGLTLSLVLDALSTSAGTEDDRTATQRRNDALVEMAHLALRAGELPDTGGDQPRVTLLVQATTNPFTDPDDHLDDEPDHGEALEALSGSSTADDDAGPGGLSLRRHLGGVPRHRGGQQFNVTGFDLADAQLLGAATLMSTETLQRICCDAEFSLATHDTTGTILNLGRSVRDPSLAQRRAVKLRDKHCVFPGCDTPPHRCQVHHIHYWANGGRTDLRNLALICHFHHHLIHEDKWTLVAAPPTPEHPTGQWIARSPDGREELRQFRQQAA
ncbi:HNH endonuclease signature motif containing protein [Acidothermaceae bacterium B102]|nr:HNH endonuclease signature motif containing protein [Acidothermaceae bacterium B102]